MTTTLDKSINPYRSDIAGEKLRGKVIAESFVAPIQYQIKVPIADLKLAPSNDAEQCSVALAGEIIEIYEVKYGFAWGQLVDDDYVGYIDANALNQDIIAPTHKVCAARTPILSMPKVQGNVLGIMPMNAKILPTAIRENGFVWCEGFGFIYEKHLCPIDEYFEDPVEVAQKFIGAPYVWGGKSALGIDCSGLVEISFAACNIELPRDARLQELRGQKIAFDDSLAGLKRGDLVFWAGHVAIMIDETNIIHANAHHMMVSIEPLRDAKARSDNSGVPIRTITRVF